MSGAHGIRSTGTTAMPTFAYNEETFADFRRICDQLIDTGRVFYEDQLYEVSVDLEDPNSWRAFFQHLEKTGAVVIKNEFGMKEVKWSAFVV